MGLLATTGLQVAAAVGFASALILSSSQRIPLNGFLILINAASKFVDGLELAGVRGGNSGLGHLEEL